MNAINTYGYMVCKGIVPFPLHIVAIYSEMHIGFNVFDNSRDARSYILNNCKDVKYNYNFDFKGDFGGLLKLYTHTDEKYFFKGTNNQLYIKKELKKGGQNNMKKLREGWHIVASYSVYVDSDGMIRHGTKKDNNGSLVPAYPYYWSHKYNCWSNAPCTPSQLYQGNWSMK